MSTQQDQTKNPFISILTQPIQWLTMLTHHLNPSFIAGIFLIYGIGQGFSGSFFKLVSDYYWKDIQKIQPSTVQLYVGIYFIPWILKPIWGILTDAFPLLGYRRRPYFILAGVVGLVSASVVAVKGNLAPVAALMCFLGVSASLAIADVTIDACIARNSIEVPGLAPDLQSLCGFCSGSGALIGYLVSGFFVHHLGPQGSLGLMAIFPALTIVLGFVIYEKRAIGLHTEKKQGAMENAGMTIRSMYKTIKYPQAWKPSLYMFLSLSLNVTTHEGHFYWYTDSKAGPAFSQEFVGVIYAIGAVASIIETAVRITGKIRWMPMMVLSAKLCPLGIEGTFFALLMCIDSVGALISKWGGGLLLRVLHITRSDFNNLWLAVLIRDILRFVTLVLVFLVPNVGPYEGLLPSDGCEMDKRDGNVDEETLELVPINAKIEV
ncbi:probable folate-biopterin transporter 6 isoform X2 [Lathyrus oleraceus]|uniref:probable folate-biopterin transporter 6 isoform X2 n=1 Tax=Pisum sativum TaxID=3888 RepID=UPI0021CFB699|nr:probable folate-biopterin transporter 6 isoform X2 [Pisum sativum]